MKKTLIIAEAGINHNGDIKKAIKLINAAKDCGADAIKFQTYSSKDITVPNAPKAKYQIIKGSKNKESMGEMLKKYELSNANFHFLNNYCKKKKIEFLSSGFDKNSILFLKKLKMKRYKIPSGEINNLPLLELISKLKKKVILSTGMSTFNEIKYAYNILKKNIKKEKITIMHCNSAYPTPFEDANLLTIKKLKRDFKTSIGYSDHTIGYEACISAITLGASVIEKHLTLNNNLSGPDHKTSLDPKNFKKMVEYVRNIEKSLFEKKGISASEKKNIKYARKAIFAGQVINKGDQLSEKNLVIKRPAVGLSPIHWNKIIKLKAIKKYLKNEKISKKNLYNFKR
jgi:N,N'-diacetyllegionaminate synthase